MAEPVRALQVVLPGTAFVSVKPMQQLVQPFVRPWRLGATMFSLFGALALILAAIGLYGLLAFEVAPRTREVGVRAALGARLRTVLAMAVGDGLRLAGAGIVVGLALTVIGGRFVAELLYDLSPRDPAIIGGGAVVLLLVAAAASLLPALRALRVDILRWRCEASEVRGAEQQLLAADLRGRRADSLLAGRAPCAGAGQAGSGLVTHETDETEEADRSA